MLGDRWELLYAVPAVALLGVPLVHLHGGEVTEGAIDDRVRHAVSKLADLHCVSTERAAARLRQLGEPAERVFVTGAPVAGPVSRTVRPPTTHLTRLLGRPLARPLALVTYHPATAGGPEPGVGARPTCWRPSPRRPARHWSPHPGWTRGREAVLAADRAGGRPRARRWWRSTRSGADYLPVLAAADVVVGNSSSGILEAA